MAFEPMLAGDVPAWEAETDVLVVGFGGAGSCAAIAAADGGAEVHLFEAASAAGGSTALSSAEIYLGGGTAVQKAVGYEDTVEAVYGYLMDCNGPQADAEKTRAYAEGGAAQWSPTRGWPPKKHAMPSLIWLGMSLNLMPPKAGSARTGTKAKPTTTWNMATMPESR